MWTMQVHGALLGILCGQRCAGQRPSASVDQFGSGRSHSAAGAWRELCKSPVAGVPERRGLVEPAAG